MAISHEDETRCFDGARTSHWLVGTVGWGLYLSAGNPITWGWPGIIPGRYWDSRIYRGRLHLFGMEGDILTLGWDALIGRLRVRDDLKLAARSAFQRSDFFYGVASTGISAMRKSGESSAIGSATSPKCRSN